MSFKFIRPWPINNNYLVSTDGQIYSKYTNKYLSVSYVSGYPRVGVTISGKPRPRAVHLMVAETFLGPRPDSFVSVQRLNGVERRCKQCNRDSQKRFRERNRL